MADEDFDCFDDLNPFDVDLSDPLEVLEQDVYHLLIEPPGSNIDDIERGIGLPDALKGRFDPTLAHRIDGQLQRDPRIDVSTTTITPTGEPDEYRIDIVVEANGEELGLIFTFDGETLTRSAA